MNIILNSQPRLTTSTNIEEMLTEFSLDSSGVAIGVNAVVIPRDRWASTPLCEGDSIVIVSAVFGG